MRSTETPPPGDAGLRWIWLGVVVMTVGAVAVFRLDDGITRVVVGGALAVCLTTVAAMVWLDRRTARSVDRRD